MDKLVRYGLPLLGGEPLGEPTMNLVALVASFHRYGEDMAAGATIAFNWGGMRFHPLIGIQVGAMTLVDQAMQTTVPT